MRNNKYLLDTNIIIDYYMCLNISDYKERHRNYCAALGRFVMFNIGSLMMTDLTEREFMLKLIDKIVESLTPPPNDLDNKSLVEYTSNLTKELTDNLQITIINTYSEILNKAYKLNLAINQAIKDKEERKKTRRKLGRDIINIIHTHQNKIPLITRDETLINALTSIKTASYRMDQERAYGLQTERYNINMKINNETLETTLILIKTQ